MQQFIELLEQMPAANIMPPANTIGHIFRHEEKENFISYWLAFLLNPEYTGNSEPLSALLQLAEASGTVDLSNVSIVRESVLEDKRRIDFIIETSSHIIGIENKIWSGLQENQLEDYRKELVKKAKTDGKDVVLILLYPQRNTCCKNLKKEELFGFKPVTYEDLVSEFKHIRFNIFDNLRATVLMEDFIIHMEEYIMKDSSNAAINWDMWQFEAVHRDRIQELRQALKGSRAQFDKYIEDRMDAIIRGRDDQDQWEKYMSGTYFQLYKTSWRNGLAHFELLKTTPDDLAPQELIVVLHTHEYKKEWRTDYLRDLGKQIGEKTFKIRYESQEEFEKSMDLIFDALTDLVNTYTDTIDTEMIKKPDPQ